MSGVVWSVEGWEVLLPQKAVGKAGVGGGGTCGKGGVLVILAPHLWRGPITF